MVLWCFFSCKDTSQVESGPTLKASFELNQFFEGSVFKYSDSHTQIQNLGNTVQHIT